VKFFIDHNLSPRLISTIAVLHPDNTYACARDEGLNAMDDIPLFGELAKRKFNAIITRDSNQLTNTVEREALIESGLHWLGVSDTKAGALRGLALDSAAITIGLTLVLPELTGEQRAYRFKAVPHQAEQRVRQIPLHR
jgi:predicted nuclease of predicted toxin-antitoxin system